MANNKNLKKQLMDLVRENSVVVILVCFVVIMQIAQPKFLTAANVRSILFNTSSFGIAAIGAMFVLITGGMDFTVGYGLALCGVIGGYIYSKTGSPILMLLSCVLFGLLIGLINSLIIIKLRIQSFIATLAMQFTLQGLVYIVSEGNIVFLKDPLSNFLGKQTILGGWIPIQAVIFLLMVVIAHVILTRTKMGTYTYALGGNEEAGRCAGINVDKYKTLVFTFAGLCTGIASVLTITQVSLISPTIGSTTLMDAIASAVIGGTSTLGGRGKAFGTLFGALIMGIVSNALILLYVPTNAQYLVKGIIILAAVCVNRFLYEDK